MRRRTQGCAGRAVNGAGERRQGRAACGAAKVCSRASSTHGHQGRMKEYTTGCVPSICADACPARLTRAGAAATGARRARRSSPAMTAPPTPAPTLSRDGRDRRRIDAPGKASGGGSRAIPAGARARAGENLTPARPAGRASAGAGVRRVPALSRQTARGLGGERTARSNPRRLARRDGRLLTSVWREADRSGVWAIAGQRPTSSH
jgi:hypothetical protein